jgi:hypothetical protein
MPVRVEAEEHQVDPGHAARFLPRVWWEDKEFRRYELLLHFRLREHHDDSLPDPRRRRSGDYLDLALINIMAIPQGLMALKWPFRASSTATPPAAPRFHQSLDFLFLAVGLGIRWFTR